MVKNYNPVKIEAPLEPWAIAAIDAQPGFEASLRPDAVLRYGRLRTPLTIEIKRNLDAAGAHAVVALAAQPLAGSEFLLVAGQTTAGARDILETNGIAYIDGTGNAYVRLPGLFVRTSGGRDAARGRAGQPGHIRLSGRAGLVAQAMLLDRDRTWTIADVASRAGVSAGLVHRVLRRLEEGGVVMSSGTGPRKTRSLSNPAALLDLWAEEDAERGVHRTPAFVLLRPGARGSEDVSRRLAEAGLDHGITGSAAAAVLAPFLTAVPVTTVRITASASPGAILRALDARPVEEGANVVALQASDDIELRFRRDAGGAVLAADTRIYVDCRREPRRGREQALAFRESVLRM